MIANLPLPPSLQTFFTTLGPSL